MENICVTIDDIQAARKRIEGKAIMTPLLQSENLSKLLGCQCFLKLETMQRVKAFKYRGALNKMLQFEKGTIVCAVSAGNHAQGLALAATECGCKSVIYMPENAATSKVDATRHYGGCVVKKGPTFDAAKAELFKDMEAHPEWKFVSPYDDKDIIAGTGTIGLEILDQMKDQGDKYTVVVPIGGGGLISGVAFALKKLNPQCRIIGVNMASCATACKRFCEAKGKPVPEFEKENRTPLADGINVKTPGDLTMPIIVNYVDEVVVVNDDDVAMSVSYLAERAKVIAEGAGAAAFAAVLAKKFSFTPDENVVIMVSGGNITMRMLARCIDRALFLRKVRVAFTVVLPFGGMYQAEFLRLLRDCGAEVKSWICESHVACVANKEKFDVIVDLPGEHTIEEISSKCDERGWIIHLSDTHAKD